MTATLSGRVVSPGESLVVVVDSPTREVLPLMMVAGPEPVGLRIIEKLPATISIPVPANAPLGPLSFAVVAMTGSGQGPEPLAGPFEVEVMRSDLPVKLRYQFLEIGYPYQQGSTPHIPLEAEFADGRVADVTYSAALTRSSTDPRVAVPKPDGFVRLVGPGRAAIVATYTVSGRSIKTTIPVTVPEPRFKAVPARLDFGTQPVGTVVTRELTLTNTAGYPLTISELGASDEFVETNTCPRSSPIAPGASCTVTVTFAPQRAGVYEGVLKVVDDAGETAYWLTGTGSRR